MNPTSIDLARAVREKAIELLRPSLAESVDLALTFKHAHWNIKGPTFAQLHELFDQSAAEMHEHADILAERIAQLGGTAEGTLAGVARHTGLPPYPEQGGRAPQHLRALTIAVAAFAKNVRRRIDEASRLGDAGTADIFTQISRAADKRLWFIESHLRP